MKGRRSALTLSLVLLICRNPVEAFCQKRSIPGQNKGEKIFAIGRVIKPLSIM
jgi:hypothetical protein